jgi:hypothetical protein
VVDPTLDTEPVSARARRLLWQRPRSVREAIYVRVAIALVLVPAVAAFYGMSGHGLLVGSLYAGVQLVLGIPLDVLIRVKRTTS